MAAVAGVTFLAHRFFTADTRDREKHCKAYIEQLKEKRDEDIARQYIRARNEILKNAGNDDFADEIWACASPL